MEETLEAKLESFFDATFGAISYAKIITISGTIFPDANSGAKSGTIVIIPGSVEFCKGISVEFMN